MRLPNSTYATRAWRLAEIAPEFRIEDVWLLPARGERDEFPELVRQIAEGEGAYEGEYLCILMFVVRQKLGAWFGLDRPETGVGGRVTSVAARLPADSAYIERGPDQNATPFKSIYQTDREWVSETAGRTVHALMHVGWVPDGVTGYRAEMAILVRPNGLIGRLYMGFIRPFRRFVVNPAFFRMVARNWERSRKTVE